MNYKEDITDILDGIVNTISQEDQLVLLSADIVNGVAVCHVEDEKWCQEDFFLNVIGRSEEDMNPHSIQVVITDVWSGHIRIKGVKETLTEVTAIYIYHLYFFHGTPIATGNELLKIQDASDKTPMVWMYENFTERFNEDDLLRLERESELKLFFLTQANHSQWVTQVAYEKAIRPMRKLMELFVQAIKNDSRFDTLDLSYNVQNYAKFGVYINEKGMPTNKFADNLSGVEMSFTLKKYKPEYCCGAC